jgi:membrane protein implicated in regulation of membrane protease activity
MKKAYYLYFIASILFMVSGIMRLMSEGVNWRGILFLVASLALLLSGISAMRRSKMD